jgi:signal transduction histidine kinase/CheY-like chemotaxis protein
MFVDWSTPGRRDVLLPSLLPRLVRALGLAVGVGIAYFLAARLSLELLTKPDGVAVFWPAAGVAAGVLIGMGRSARLPVVAGVIGATVAANMLGDRNIWSAIVFALCNAGEALLVATLIDRFFGLPFGLERLHHVIGLIAAALAATAISGIGGTLGYVFFHTTAPPLTIWQHWFASDAIGVIAVAPLLLELFSAARDPPSRRELFEGSLALAVVTALSVVVTRLPNEAWAVEITIAAPLPLFLWIAARCRPVFAATAIFIFALTIVWTTTFGIGAFGNPDLAVSERILLAQFSILVQSLCALVLAALFAERRRHIADLLDNQTRLRAALKAAREADQAKTSFLAAASHDLRQPLQTLTLLQAALRPEVHDDKACSLLAQMDRAVDVMNGMLISLLDINRLEAGILRPSIKDFSATELFDSLAADFLKPAQEKGLEWRIVRSGLWLRTDRQMLEEMLRNLLSNAIRYTDHGRILVGCRRVADSARIQVWDSGVGISGEDIPKIFEEHYQAPRTAQLGGFGLGLAIVQRLAKMLGHRVDVISTPGKGSGFSIEVPLGPPDLVTQERGAAATADVALSGTVLLIEDEGGVRLAFSSFLRSYGLDVIAVGTAEQALRCVAGGMIPDLIVSDYNLPGKMNGVETIKALRKTLVRDIPAIVVTGDTRKEILDGIALHHIGIVVKPAQADEILKIVTSLVPVSAPQTVH